MSTRPLRIGRDWCGANSAPSVGGPSCRGVGGDHNHYQWLYQSEHSYEEAWQDTDTSGVLPGCTIVVQRNEDGDEFDPIETFTATDETWFKVVNVDDIDIESYTCAHENLGTAPPLLSPAPQTRYKNSPELPPLATNPLMPPRRTIKEQKFGGNQTRSRWMPHGKFTQTEVHVHIHLGLKVFCHSTSAQWEYPAESLAL